MSKIKGIECNGEKLIKYCEKSSQYKGTRRNGGSHVIIKLQNGEITHSVVIPEKELGFGLASKLNKLLKSLGVIIAVVILLYIIIIVNFV